MVFLFILYLYLFFLIIFIFFKVVLFWLFGLWIIILYIWEKFVIIFIFFWKVIFVVIVFVFNVINIVIVFNIFDKLFIWKCSCVYVKLFRLVLFCFLFFLIFIIKNGSNELKIKYVLSVVMMVVIIKFNLVYIFILIIK